MQAPARSPLHFFVAYRYKSKENAGKSAVSAAVKKKIRRIGFSDTPDFFLLFAAVASTAMISARAMLVPVMIAGNIRIILKLTG